MRQRLCHIHPRNSNQAYNQCLERHLSNSGAGVVNGTCLHRDSVISLNCCLTVNIVHVLVSVRNNKVQLVKLLDNTIISSTSVAVLFGVVASPCLSLGLLPCFCPLKGSFYLTNAKVLPSGEVLGLSHN